MNTAPDFRLYHANSLEVLAVLLAEEIRKPVPGQPLLVPETVLIPQAAIRRWLQATLAARHGITANLEFLTPGEFVARALKANVAGEGGDLDVGGLHWRLYAALGDVEVLRQPVLRAMAEHVCTETGTPDPLRAWALAGELAAAFEKYQAWRRDWLLQWDEGAEPDNPQAVLWRQVTGGMSHRARRIQAYLDGFEAPHQPRPQKLPKRLFAFATLSVSPDVLRVIATQARVGTLHLYVPSPTPGEWGDLVTRAEQRQYLRDVAEGAADGVFAEPVPEHRLLQAWGGAGRDFMRMLATLEVISPNFDLPAYVDPLADTRPTLAQGGLADSLLHRLQGDLFHRRPVPSGALRDTPRLDDPSVQLHACHTRLRELQVLHDQLRALLDDPRFDPPLEPREIAVLAPDIAAYAPYLGSVFAHPGEPDWLSWTLADTRPLDTEPLAEGFMQLLHLPISRFGLNEMMDLIVSTPLAAAAGLDGDGIERLRQWLYDAGARWALNPEHRREHLAPDDDAFTWRFALERLLLGHATGADAEITANDGQMVAPWPELEGAALDALGRLLGLLERLETARSTLGTPASPDEWRQRLFTLIDDLLQGERAARTRERLRQHVHAFAHSAQQAGFDGDVPPEVVRAYFAKALSEADTRAPLLTGGISFGRMVPMRLLPFRVICVLGLNDGEFPHRDASAGLNRMLAELHGGQRRAGDRSTRDDDRFLFLQLMLAAQDVFYLSWLGADPRDGSAREPSVLVSQWLDALADYHTDPNTARKALVVQHPLQPFSPAAFGAADDPRRFSHHAQWAPAAARTGAPREALPPWFKPPLPMIQAGEGNALSVDALRRFFSNPAGHFLRQRLGVRLEDELDDVQDIEPLVLPGRREGRAYQHLRQQVLHELLNAQGDDANLYPRLRARALLPSGALGARQLREVVDEVRYCAEDFLGWYDGQPLRTQSVSIDIDNIRLHGQIEGIHPQGLVRLSPVAVGVSWTIRTGLDWLLANAAGLALPVLRFIEDRQRDYGPHLLPALPEAQARAALGELLRLHAEGQSAPLLFAPYTGWEIWNAAPDKRTQAARSRWYGSAHSWGETGTPALQLAFRGRDPFASEAGTQQLIANSLRIFSVLCKGEVFEDGV